MGIAGHFPLPAPNPLGPEMQKESERDLDERVAERLSHPRMQPTRRATWRERLRLFSL